MSTAVASDTLLSDRATSLRAILNAGHQLKLFTDDLSPAPNTPRSAYHQPSWAGYAAQSLSGIWGPVSKVQPGQWIFEAPVLTFTRTGGTASTVFGWWIDSGTQVRFAQRFPAPIDTGLQTVIPVLLRFEEWSLSLLL